MKKLLYTLAAVLVCTGAAAQNPTLYFMEGKEKFKKTKLMPNYYL